MKKAIIVATVPSMIGQFNMNNIRILQELGYEVHAACNFHDTSVWTVVRTKVFLAELKEKRICYHQIDFPRRPSDFKCVFSAYRQFMNLIRNEEYDLIHCHTPIAGVISRLVAHKQKIKVIYTAHGFHFYQGAPLKNWIVYYSIEKWLSRYTDILITINKEDYRRAKKNFHAKKIVYVPGVGVDTEKFASRKSGRNRIRAELGLDERTILLLSVGELNENKNHESVIRAIQSLPDITYVIVGKGGLKKKLEETAKTCDVDLRLTGFRTDVADFYDAADIYILPSIREGLNVSLMEAMVSGLPVVCSRIRGNTDLIDDGKGGYLFNPSEIDDVEKSIGKLMEEDRVKFGTHNLQKISKFDLKNVEKQMTEVYGGIGHHPF